MTARTSYSEKVSRPRVVIVGAGFGGLAAARALRSVPVDVLLIDRTNYHTFQPLLYQVATAALEPDEIAHAVRGIFHRHERFRFRLGRVTSIDWERRAVILDETDPIPFDFLILAAGAATNYFGIQGAAEYSFELKSLEHALALRSHIIRQFEIADQQTADIDPGRLTFVAVGGGPTGVETTGALIELFERVMRKDYPDLSQGRIRVILLEASDDLLAAFSSRLRTYAHRTLEKRGVEVRLGDPVIEVTPEAVHLRSGAAIPTRTVIWSAGVRTSPLADRSNLAQERAGRIAVNADLSVPGREGVFVIGDMAASRDDEGRLHPQVAPVAIQSGKHAARQIERLLDHKATTAFSFQDPGIMATIGRNSAVVQFPIGLKATGFAAWVMWLGLHLIQLIGFRNRLNVLINWAWNYFTYDRSARLILGDPEEADAEAEGVEAHAGGARTTGGAC